MRLRPTHTYEVIAAAFRATRPKPVAAAGGARVVAACDDAARVQWEHDVRAMAHALKSSNPSFRIDLFLEQSGYE